MIKVITSFVSCLAAILLGILALATDYWRVWWKEAKEIEGVQYHHEGLFQTCSESTIKGTVVAADKCTKLHDLGRPGTCTSSLNMPILCLKSQIWLLHVEDDIFVCLAYMLYNDMTSW